jgi:NADH-quinone oxidoreductase subunit A
MNTISEGLFSPPAVFLIILVFVGLFSFICSALAFRNKKQSSESKEAYACGEDFQEHMIQPDYSQFFPFAFFFTILHVVVLVIATIPRVDMAVFGAAMVYILGAIIGLFSLLRK